MNAGPTGRDLARARSARAAELRRNFHESRGRSVYPSSERVQGQARVSGVVPRTPPRRYTLGELTTMIDQEVKNVKELRAVVQMAERRLAHTTPNILLIGRTGRPVPESLASGLKDAERRMADAQRRLTAARAAAARLRTRIAEKEEDMELKSRLERAIEEMVRIQQAQGLRSPAASVLTSPSDHWE